MMFHYPYFSSSYYRSYPQYSYVQNRNFQKHKQNTVNLLEKKKVDEIEKEEAKEIKDTQEDRQCFEILGIKLYFDDILLICLIFFLYNEGIQDQSLFISLILLLLS